MSILEVNHVSIRYMTGDFKEIGLKEFIMRKMTNNYNVVEFWANQDITFSIEKGDMLGIIGTNGAGKSTTLNTVSGLLRSRTGSITFAGENLGHVPCHKIVSKGLALVPEGRRIFQQMTVRENLEMGGFTRPKAEIPVSMEEMFTRFPRLKEREKQIAGTLSGGEQQMLAIARAMMSKPRLLMLDEPSMGLAPILVEQIFDIIKELHAAGVTILLVEQNAQMALSIADRAYVLETGMVSKTGPAIELLHDDDVRKAYLGN